MTEKEMIEQLINQNNNNMNCFIAIVFGSIALIIVIYTFLEKKLSDKKIDFIINSVETDMTRKFYQENIKLITTIKENMHGTTQEIDALKSEIRIMNVQEIQDQIMNITGGINKLSKSEILNNLLGIQAKLTLLQNTKEKNLISPKMIQSINYCIQNSKYNGDAYITKALDSINKLV